LHEHDSVLLLSSLLSSISLVFISVYFKTEDVGPVSLWPMSSHLAHRRMYFLYCRQRHICGCIGEMNTRICTRA